MEPTSRSLLREPWPQALKKMCPKLQWASLLYTFFVCFFWCLLLLLSAVFSAPPMCSLIFFDFICMSEFWYLSSPATSCRCLVCEERCIQNADTWKEWGWSASASWQMGKSVSRWMWVCFQEEVTLQHPPNGPSGKLVDFTGRIPDLETYPSTCEGD